MCRQNLQNFLKWTTVKKIESNKIDLNSKQVKKKLLTCINHWHLKNGDLYQILTPELVNCGDSDVSTD